MVFICSMSPGESGKRNCEKSRFFSLSSPLHPLVLCSVHGWSKRPQPCPHPLASPSNPGLMSVALTGTGAVFPAPLGSTMHHVIEEHWLLISHQPTAPLQALLTTPLTWTIPRKSMIYQHRFEDFILRICCVGLFLGEMGTALFPILVRQDHLIGRETRWVRLHVSCCHSWNSIFL